MIRRIFTFKNCFAATAIFFLFLGFPLASFNATSTRIWLPPNYQYGIDIDSNVIIRCGSGAQNLFNFPVIGWLLVFSVAVPCIWLLSRFWPQLKRHVEQERHDAMMSRIREFNRQKICMTCGYDLRATPEKCPECGTAVKTPAGAE